MKIFFLIIGTFIFVLNASDILTDKDTDLIWQDNYEAKSVKKAYPDAKSYCENLVLGGHSDWRLPNIDELISITDKSKYKPSIKGSFNNVKSSYYWTITKTKWNLSKAWVVNFTSGSDGDYDLSKFNYVRCVR